MKKILFALLVTNCCLAQGFIEVEVRDTLMMKPVGFVYEISLSDRDDYEAVSALSDEETEIDVAKIKNDKKNAETRKMNELEQFFKKNQYKFEPGKNYDVNSYLSNSFKKTYLVTVKSAEALDKLTAEIEKMDQFSGSIASIDYGNQDNLESKLTDKLLKKAKAKSLTIAGMTDQKLGAIIEFRELKASDNLNYTVVDLILNSRKRNTRDFFKQSLDGELSKTIIVRFKTQ